MLYWKGEELGVVTKPKDTIFINNCKTSNTEPGFIPGEGAMTPLSSKFGQAVHRDLQILREIEKREEESK